MRSNVGPKYLLPLVLRVQLYYIAAQNPSLIGKAPMLGFTFGSNKTEVMILF